MSGAMAPRTGIGGRYLCCCVIGDQIAVVLLYLVTSNCFAQCPPQVQGMCDPVSVYFPQIAVQCQVVRCPYVYCIVLYCIDDDEARIAFWAS